MRYLAIATSFNIRNRLIRQWLHQREAIAFRRLMYVLDILPIDFINLMFYEGETLSADDFYWTLEQWKSLAYKPFLVLDSPHLNIWQEVAERLSERFMCNGILSWPPPSSVLDFLAEHRLPFILHPVPADDRTPPLDVRLDIVRDIWYTTQKRHIHPETVFIDIEVYPVFSDTDWPTQTMLDFARKVRHYFPSLSLVAGIENAGYTLPHSEEIESLLMVQFAQAGVNAFFFNPFRALLLETFRHIQTWII